MEMAIGGFMNLSNSLAATGLSLAVLIALPISAYGGEVRVGVSTHDVNVLNTRRQIENSTAVSGEYIFETPKWLEWAASANPYVYGTLNLNGKTDHGGVGLNWRQSVGKFYAEFGTGLSAHDGTVRIVGDVDLSLPQPELDIAINRFFDRFDNELEFGSRVLFRNQVALGYEINDQWGADIYYEHLSHAQILGGPQNDGLDNVGVRVSRKF